MTLLLNTTDPSVPALGDPNVRKALSAALDRSEMATQCEDSFELPATSSSGLTKPIDSALIPSSLANDLSTSPDMSAVKTDMAAAGYTMVGSQWEKGGKNVTFTIIDPNSFGDYWCDAQQMQQQLDAAGFNVQINGAFT